MMLEFGTSTPPVIAGPTDEEIRKKALERERKIKASRARFSRRQETLGAVQLQAPALGGI